MKIFLIGLGCILLAWIIYFFMSHKKKSSTLKLCSSCGDESQYGYSESVEENIKNIKYLCRKCLVSQLDKDYTTFSGRAVVIQPAAGPPCYVFHSNDEWGKLFKESKMDDDARAYLLRMNPICHDCDQMANFLWIESSGLTEHNFGNVLKNGFAETLLPRNPKPISLCGKCCIRYIVKELEGKDITYLGISGPKGGEDGFVAPMGS